MVVSAVKPVSVAALRCRTNTHAFPPPAASISTCVVLVLHLLFRRKKSAFVRVPVGARKVSKKKVSLKTLLASERYLAKGVMLRELLMFTTSDRVGITDFTWKVAFSSKPLPTASFNLCIMSLSR